MYIISNADLLKLNTPQNQGSGNYYYHKTNVLFLNAPVRSTPPEDYPLNSLYYLEYPPETSDVEGILDYTKNIASYVSNPESTFLVLRHLPSYLPLT